MRSSAQTVDNGGSWTALLAVVVARRLADFVVRFLTNWQTNPGLDGREVINCCYRATSSVRTSCTDQNQTGGLIRKVIAVEIVD